MDSFRDLFYPESCGICARKLYGGEILLCTHCFADLPRARFSCSAENPMIKQLWGRCDVEACLSWTYFKPGSGIRILMHGLKYSREREFGYHMGEWFAREQRRLFERIRFDVLVPVPVHPDKLPMRGYNQSEVIAVGMAKEFACPIRSDALVRRGSAGTQTHLGRFDRFVNTQSKYIAANVEGLEGKRILLIDDVFTTGATIEACAKALQEAGASVSVATLAMAWK
jgi:ComF family protein